MQQLEAEVASLKGQLAEAHKTIEELKRKIDGSSAVTSVSETKVVEQVPAATADSSSSSPALISLKEFSFLSPRGKFAVSISSSHLRLENKTQGRIEIPKEKIARALLLPVPNQLNQSVFVIKVDGGVAVGKSNIDLVVVQAKATEIAGIASSSLEPPAPTNVAAPALLAHLVNQIFSKKAETPNLMSNFSSENGKAGVACNARNVRDGFLFPLEKSLFFLGSPLLLIDLSKISNVELTRVSNSFCDLVVDIATSEEEGGGDGDGDAAAKKKKKKAGEGVESFTMIPVGEYPMLMQYLVKRKLIGRSEKNSNDTDNKKKGEQTSDSKKSSGNENGQQAKKTSAAAPSEETEDEDEDDDSDDSDDDFDPTAVRKKKSSKEEEDGTDDDDDDDEDEEEDDDDDEEEDGSDDDEEEEGGGGETEEDDDDDDDDGDDDEEGRPQKKMRN